MRKIQPGALLVLALLGLVVGSSVTAHSGDFSRYRLSYLKTMRALGLALYDSLKPELKEAINPEPVSLTTEITPLVQLATLQKDGKAQGYVYLSVGMLDLVNNLAHAKAIDKVDKGYFEKYVLSLGHENGEKELKDLPGLDKKKYWSDKVMNEHLSSLRQMVVIVVGINLAHHYLGHYTRYADKLNESDAKGNPLSNFTTHEEWEAALRAGTKHALETGQGIEGARSLFEAIGKMTNRPPWTAYFLPLDFQSKPVVEEMEKIERAFFDLK